jgi:ATP adenylyltransferase
MLPLWSLVAERSERAQALGALSPIRTQVRLVEDAGMRFSVRIVDSLKRKARARAAAPADPFGPWDPELFVADATERHVVLLNKYPVLPNHVLLVTRRFEEQESPLGLQDFEAFCWGLGPGPALGFYNAGAMAGASQRHKHLQLVALPWSAAEPKLPLESVVEHARDSAGRVCNALPFRHAVAALGRRWWQDPGAPSAVLELTSELMRAVGYPAFYNLLLTRRFVMVVPRVAERFGSISVNALGFAGALLVKDERQERELLDAGPMAALVATAGPSRA